ncbi:hypothetical protein N7490_002112 [Penicillium lividum]|nr:hypothetical protein N7490_002112 [Penicillium lividum]
MTRGQPRDPARYLPQAPPIQRRIMQGVTRLVEAYQTAPTPPRTDRLTMSKVSSPSAETRFFSCKLPHLLNTGTFRSSASHETEKTSTRGEEGRVCTEISGGSRVLNGDARRRPQADVSRTHTITGGQ